MDYILSIGKILIGISICIFLVIVLFKMYNSKNKSSIPSTFIDISKGGVFIRYIKIFKENTTNEPIQISNIVVHADPNTNYLGSDFIIWSGDDIKLLIDFGTTLFVHAITITHLNEDDAGSLIGYDVLFIKDNNYGGNGLGYIVYKETISQVKTIREIHPNPSLSIKTIVKPPFLETCGNECINNHGDLLRNFDYMSKNNCMSVLTDVPKNMLRNSDLFQNIYFEKCKTKYN